jgi:hypothetical protein
VADDGPGIPDDQLEEVLQPFVRLDNARSRDTPGWGWACPSSTAQSGPKTAGCTCAMPRKAAFARPSVCHACPIEPPLLRSNNSLQSCGTTEKPPA